jgi:lysophospholipase L1-like esterase
MPYRHGTKGETMNRNHALLLGLGLLAGCVWDVNGDGQVVVACLGDSNSAFPFGMYCEQLAVQYPEIVFVSYAVPGSRAIGGTDDGLSQIAEAAAGVNGPPADVVLLAFGTNDIGGGGVSATEVADRIDTLNAAAADAGMPALVATLPPRFLSRADGSTTCTPNAVATPIIEATNALLRERIDPTWLVDFDSGFVCPTHFFPDGVHMSAAGVELRAERAAEAIFYVP